MRTSERTWNKRMTPLMLATGCSLAMTAPLEVLYARRLGAGSVALGLFVLASGIGVLLVDVLGTRFVPRLDSRRALSTGVTIFGLSSVLLGASPGYAPLVLARMTQGIGGAVINGTALQAAVRVHESRDRALGVVQSSLMLGGAMGAPAGGMIASALPGTAGFRLAFAVCAACCFAIALTVRLRMPALAPAAAGPARLGFPRFAVPPALRLALVVGMLGHYLRGGLENTTLPLVGDARGFSTASIGVALGVLSVVQIGVLRASGTLFARWGPVPCLRAALALGVAATALLALTTSLGAFVASATMFGAVDAIAMVAPPVVIMSLSQDASSGLASYRIACGVGSLLGATTVTAAVALAGALAAISVVGGALIASITLVAALGRQATVT